MNRYRKYNNKALLAFYQSAFASGAGSVLSLKGQTIYLQPLKRPQTGLYSDASAIRSDWNRVGNQLLWAVKTANI